jgi:hypothetical protein
MFAINDDNPTVHAHLSTSTSLPAVQKKGKPIMFIGKAVYSVEV